MPTSRRKFIRQTAAAAMGTGLTTMLPLDAIAQMRCRVSANDKINVGLIGCKGMGWSNLSTLLINVPEAEVHRFSRRGSKRAGRTGRKVYWDAASGAFKNDTEANALLKANYQNGWKLPKS